MKRKKLLSICILLVFTSILICCKNDSPDLSGTWATEPDRMNEIGSIIFTFTKGSDSYIISCKNYYGSGPINFIGKYEDGVIKYGQGLRGDFTYSKEQDKIYFNGGVYSRKTPN